jgi:parallel beta-helix repeat protein
MMGRKVAGVMAATVAVVLTVVLVGGQVGSGGFLWWGNREPIYIYGDSGFTVQNGVFSGSGTASDPYIIEGWHIDRPNADYGIYIDHTTAHFVIRDCVIEGTRQAGIYFNSVRNGRVENVQIGRSGTAVHLLNASYNHFEGNVFAENLYGVVATASSQGNVLTGNSFLRNGQHGVDLQRRNQWYAHGVGNYWSDYVGYDGDHDGVGDIPYFRLYDRYPLMAPPVEWTRVAPAGLTYAGNQVAPDGSLVVTSQTPISLSALDPGTGVAEIRYTLDGGVTWHLYDEPIHLTGEDGPRRLSYYAIDHLGNMEQPKTVCFLLDNHPPMTQIEVGEPKHEDERGLWITSSSRISLHLVQGSTYGWTQTFYRIDDRGWQRYASPFTVMGSDGPRRISFYSINASGVTEAMQTIVLLKDDAAPHTRGAKASAPTTSVQVGPTTPANEEVEEPLSRSDSSDPLSEAQTDLDEASEDAADVDDEDDEDDEDDPEILTDLPVESGPESSVQTPSETP